VSSKSKRLF